MPNKMTYADFKAFLERTHLFTHAECHAISRAPILSGKYSIGGAVVACQKYNIELTSDGIDTMIKTLYDDDDME